MTSISFIKFIDSALGPPISLVLAPFSGKKEIMIKSPQKILFIQLWSIGETILTLPAIRAVKKHYKDSKITVLCTERNEDVFSAADLDIDIQAISMNPFSISKYLLANSRKYDLVIDMEEYLYISAICSFFLGRQRIGFSGKLRAMLYNKSIRYNDEQHVMQTFLDLSRIIGADCNEMVGLNCTPNENDIIKSMIERIPPRTKIIGIAPGAAESAKSRMWPSQNFTKLCRLLISDFKCYLIIIGSAEERGIADGIEKEVGKNIINTAGELSVKQLFCLIQQLDLLISNDTGPLHIASALNISTVALFGPNTPIRFGPLVKNSISLYKKGSCEFSPCINVHLGKVPDCLYPKKSPEYQKCMKSIRVGEVMDAVKKVMK